MKLTIHRKGHELVRRLPKKARRQYRINAVEHAMIEFGVPLKFAKDILKQRVSERHASMMGLIYGSFVLEKTPEGWTYWLELIRKHTKGIYGE